MFQKAVVLLFLVSLCYSVLSHTSANGPKRPYESRDLFLFYYFFLLNRSGGGGGEGGEPRVRFRLPTFQYFPTFSSTPLLKKLAT